MDETAIAMECDSTTNIDLWICVFCKIGPFCQLTKLGDLFGPYIISTTSPDFYKTGVSINQIKDTEISGMYKIGEETYEIWIHERCALWAPSVFMAGSKLMGLECAAWSYCRTKCMYCERTGANVSCSHGTCDEAAHIFCAMVNYWTLVEDEYKALCPRHYFEHN